MNKQELLNELKIPAKTLTCWLKEGMPYEIEHNKPHFNVVEVKKWINERKENSPINQLIIGQAYLNDQIAETFKCSQQGGMRRSHTTNTLVLFTDQSKKGSIYQDKWTVEDGKDILHYTGMGQEGDQRIEWAQNKTLYESNELSIEVHLFETVKNTQHIYRGIVSLIDTPYNVHEKDKHGNMRKVIKFPLIVAHDVIRFDTSVVKEAARPYKVSAAAPEDIKAKAIAASAHNEEMATQTAKNEKIKVRATSRKVTSVVYDRDENIALYAKQRANGICQLCEQPAPFNDAQGQPYLESHHIEWLSRGGLDTVENTIALCCNCHKKMHVVNDPNDVEKLKMKATTAK